MNINVGLLLERLEALAFHWSLGPRAIGQTTAMKMGTDKANCFVVAHTAEYAKEIAGKRGLSMSALPDKVRGCSTPLLVDHYVMGILLHDAATVIRKLEIKLAAEKRKNKISPPPPPAPSSPA